MEPSCCPFCGSDKIIISCYSTDGWAGKVAAFIAKAICHNCLAHGPETFERNEMLAKTRAIIAWNKRS